MEIPSSQRVAAPAGREKNVKLRTVVAELILELPRDIYEIMKALLQIAGLFILIFVACPLTWITVPVFIADQFGCNGVLVLTIVVLGWAIAMEIESWRQG